MELVPTAVRSLQLLFVIILTGLIGNVIASNIYGHQSAINYSMFVIVLSWLAALYGLVALFVESLAIPIVMLVLDAISALFTFIAAIVLAARLGAVNCSRTALRPSNWIAYGSANDEKRCRKIQAADAFMWFLFVTCAATSFLNYLSLRRSGGIRRSGGPAAMSQVGA